MSGYGFSPDPEWNLLVLSDLHLGDQLPGEDRTRVQWNADFISHHFCAFLDYYARHRVDDRPWRLLLAGDMIDFMRINIPADESEDQAPRSQPSNEQEAWHLPPGDIQGALQKVEQVFTIHQRTFQKLGQFLMHGHEVIMITGNHDAELNWIEVQEAIREQLFQLTLGGGEQAEPHKHVFEEKLRFLPWFYYEPDRIYVEHGHMYDRYCNIEDFLALNESQAPDEILSFSHLLTQYQFRSEEAFSGLPLEHIDEWTAGDMLSWLLSRPTRQKWLLFVHITSLVWALVRTAWSSHYRRASALPHHCRQQALRRIAHEQGLPVEAIEPLQRFITVPIHARLFDTIQSLYLDRVALVGLTVFFMLVGLVAPWSAFSRAAFLTLIATCFVGAFSYLSKRHPATQAAPALLSAAYRISSYLRAPLIVFGHSHQFARKWLHQSQLYINLGSWVPSELVSEEWLTPPLPQDTEALPHTPPFGLSSVPSFETTFIMLTTDQGKHSVFVGQWQSQGGPPLLQEVEYKKNPNTEEALATALPETC